MNYFALETLFKTKKITENLQSSTLQDKYKIYLEYTYNISTIEYTKLSQPKWAITALTLRDVSFPDPCQKLNLPSKTKWNF